ncbi:MAG: type VI secretion system lipoprotein TssJ, partial [Pseudomonadota bacterium]
YYLRSTAKFNAADFFAVFDEPEATLGPDLASVDEYLLAPGKSVADAKSFDAAPVAVGVVAAFREIGQPGWRKTAPLAPNADNPVAVTLDGNQVGIGQ